MERSDLNALGKGQPADNKHSHHPPIYFFLMSAAPANKTTSLRLTSNQDSRCHGCHGAWRVIQVQHVSRHLVKLVHRILKHEGHRHIGELGGWGGIQKRKERTVSDTCSFMYTHPPCIKG